VLVVVHPSTGCVSSGIGRSVTKEENVK